MKVKPVLTELEASALLEAVSDRWISPAPFGDAGRHAALQRAEKKLRDKYWTTVEHNMELREKHLEFRYGPMDSARGPT